jgi:heme exporter protein CcmD
MSQWVFVIAAYSVAVVAVAGLIAWSFATMRRAERDADALNRR